MYTSILICGFGGGAVRGLVGFIKHQYAYKDVKFNLSYFLMMFLMSGIIGLLVTVSIKEAGISFGGSTFSSAFAFIVGYAGGDFIENIYKIITKKATVYKSYKVKEN